ncbi:hypothetical protein NLZ15_22710 (plasmid) [Atlantibacter subterranea]|uniref:hypothetical protein n=1 Tax=Atlantibacter subterraneus TaxID=255519 RepID=UPI0020C3E167|nr:hypothetical protein [Atlantibacter subterranea]UTJ49787.1 hypothetical protein NLZ15_22710 [Atlantibacter subterranea]
MTGQRNAKGQFAPGHAGGPGGARKRKTPEQKLLEAIERDAPGLVERALIVAQTDNAVLAEVIRYLTECLATKNLQAAAELAAMQYTAAGGVH